MGTRTITVNVGNNLNAIVKGGKNVDARVTFTSVNLIAPDAMSYTTPQIRGGSGSGKFDLTFSAEHPKLTIGAGANTLGTAPNLVIDEIPFGALDLYVNLEGTYNGKIDIQVKFTP